MHYLNEYIIKPLKYFFLNLPNIWECSSLLLFKVMIVVLVWYFFIYIKTKYYYSKKNKIEISNKRKSIYLIHGTWGNILSGWYKKGSDFRKSILNNNYDIHSFNWTGNNSFYARKVATLELKKSISKEVEMGKSITLVGHSHGGNIALDARALFDKEKQKNIKIICISTPILIVMNNTKTIKKMIGLIVTAIMLSWASFMSFYNWLSGDNQNYNISYVFSHLYQNSIFNDLVLFQSINEYCKTISPVFYPYILFFLFTLLVAILLYKIRVKIIASFQINDFNTMDYHRENVLQTKFIRTPGDEISGLFSASYLFTRLISMLVNLPYNIKKLFSKIISYDVREFVAILFSLPIILLVFYFLYKNQYPLIFFIGAFLVISAVSNLFFLNDVWLFPLILLTILMYPILIVLNSIINLFAGPESAMLGTWQLFSSEPTPIRDWDIITFETQKDSLLNHTAFSNEEDIQNWLKENV